MWNLLVLFDEQKERHDKPASKRSTVRGFEPLQGFCKSKTLLFVLASFYLFFFVIVNSFFSLFFLGLHLLKAEESNEHFQNYDSFVAIAALTVRVLEICSCLSIC